MESDTLSGLKVSDSLPLEYGSQINSDVIWNVAREITQSSPSISPSSSPTKSPSIEAFPQTKSPVVPVVIEPFERHIEFTRNCLEVEFDGDIKQVCSRI